MKSSEVIRLFIIAAGILFACGVVVNLIDLISSLLVDDKAPLGMLLKCIGFTTASWLSTRFNRRIANFIDRQN